MLHISSFSHNILMQVQQGMFDNPVDGFKHYREKGLEYSDIIAAFFDLYPLDEYMKYYDLSGVKPGSLIIGNNFAARDKEEREKNICILEEYMEQMSKYGIGDMMLSPMTEPAKNQQEFYELREMTIEGYGLLVDYAKKIGVGLSFENRNSLERVDSGLEDIKYILDNVTGLDFVLDTANAYLVDEDAREMYNTLRDRIRHFHFKDWVKDENGTIKKNGVACLEGCALGRGILPLGELLNTLVKDNFDGRLSIEISTYNQVSIEMLDESIAFLQAGY